MFKDFDYRPIVYKTGVGSLVYLNGVLRGNGIVYGIIMSAGGENMAMLFLPKDKSN